MTSGEMMGEVGKMEEIVGKMEEIEKKEKEANSLPVSPPPPPSSSPSPSISPAPLLPPTHSPTHPPPSPSSPPSSPLSPLRLSQGHLTLLTTCPRKFQHVVLEQLSSPNPPDQQEKLNQGSRFHLLLQQWQLDLPVESFVQEDPQLSVWFNGFLQSAAQILSLDSNPSDQESNPLCQTEHQRTLEFEGYLLTVVYDLLISNPDQAKILDWKTYPRPRNPRWLRENWQTRLYPFVLIETSSYAPEQISMVYWFFQSQADDALPQSLSIPYDRTQYDQTRQELTHLLSQLTHWLERYRSGEPFPQVPVGAKACEECSFAVRCDRAPTYPTSPNQNLDSASFPDTPFTLPSLPDIQEIPL